MRPAPLYSMKSAPCQQTNKWPLHLDVTETDVVFAVPGGLPHAVKEDALQLGPYRVSRGHFLLGDFQESGKLSWQAFLSISTSYVLVLT